MKNNTIWTKSIREEILALLYIIAGTLIYISEMPQYPIGWIKYLFFIMGCYYYILANYYEIKQALEERTMNDEGI